MTTLRFAAAVQVEPAVLVRQGQATTVVFRDDLLPPSVLGLLNWLVLASPDVLPPEPPAAAAVQPVRRLEVSTCRMPGNCDLTDYDAVTLWLRDGMLPRATIYELGVLLSRVRVASVGPRVDEAAA